MKSISNYTVGDRCLVMCTGLEKTTVTSFNVVVATDTPHNNLPKEKEINLAIALGMSDNGQSIFTISSILLGTKITIKKLVNDPMNETPPHSIFMCNSYHCNNLKQHQHMLMTCPNMHALCANHLVPWSKSNNCVDDICCQDFSKLVKRFMSKNRLSDDYLSTRALLGYNSFARSKSERDADKSIAAAATCSTWECQRCREDMAYHKKEPVKEPFCSISQLHAQLNGLEFDININEPESQSRQGVESKSKSNEPPSNEIDPDSCLLLMSVDVMDVLLERGVSVADLEGSIDQVELDEVEHLSVDDVVFLLDSYKRSKKGKKSKARTASPPPPVTANGRPSLSKSKSSRRPGGNDNVEEESITRPAMMRQSSMMGVGGASPSSQASSTRSSFSRGVSRHASMGSMGENGKKIMFSNNKDDDSHSQSDSISKPGSMDSSDEKPLKAVTIHIPHNMGRYDGQINGWFTQYCVS